MFLGILTLSILTLLSGALSYWSREAIDQGWYSERAGVSWIAMSVFAFCLFCWIVIIFNLKIA